MGSKDTQNVSTEDIEKVNRLSAIVAKALNIGEPTEGSAYRAVSLLGGGDRRAIASAFWKTAVGYRLAPVLKPTQPLPAFLWKLETSSGNSGFSAHQLRTKRTG
jgi:hypothetical protein